MNWEEFSYNNVPDNASKKYCLGFTVPLVYIPQWNKCYWLEGLRYGGNGNRIKAYLKDPYNSKHHYKEAKGMELVVKIG